MSQALFPTLPGLTFDITREPIWSTTKKTSVSGRRFGVANMSYPRYKYKLSYAFLRQTTGFTEFATLVGFFNARYGDFDSFLFPDPDDYTVTVQPIGLGDGSNKLFQLVRTFGGFVEPVFDANSAPLIYVNGVLKTLTTDYTISTTGLVTFVTAPGVGLAVTWTGTYYRRMYFSQGTAQFNKFMSNLWELKTLEIESWRP
jgi:uncharacterized protein (TIGR02217 family)